MDIELLRYMNNLCMYSLYRYNKNKKADIKFSAYTFLE